MSLPLCSYSQYKGKSAFRPLLDFTAEREEACPIIEEARALLDIPALDLHRGRCVRLYQGDPDGETVFSNGPVEAVLLWQEQGEGRLDIVDLDGVFSGCTPQPGGDGGA